MLTNEMGLPEAILRAIRNDSYNPGDGDISVTTLIAPAYQRWLRKHTEPIEDASSRIWSLIGQAVHTILERAAPEGVIAEQRLYTAVNGWKVGGQMDTLEISSGRLLDYKITSVWSVMGEAKTEWEQQLNMLRLLCVRNGLDVKELAIVAILRDWSKAKSLQEGYPRSQVAVVPIKLWALDETERFMEARVRAHQEESPPICSDDERWKAVDVYAVMKNGRKTAVKLHDDENSAKEHAASLGAGHFVHKRPGVFRRCADYCNVAHACPANRTEF